MLALSIVLPSAFCRPVLSQVLTLALSLVLSERVMSLWFLLTGDRGPPYPFESPPLCYAELLQINLRKKIQISQHKTILI